MATAMGRRMEADAHGGRTDTMGAAAVTGMQIGQVGNLPEPTPAPYPIGCPSYARVRLALNESSVAPDASVGLNAQCTAGGCDETEGHQRYAYRVPSG